MEIKNKTEIIEKINKRFLGLAGNQHHIFTIPEWTVDKEMTTITSPLRFFCSNPRCKEETLPFLFVDKKEKYAYLRFICNNCGQWASIEIPLQDIIIIKPQDKGDGLLHDTSWDKIWDKMTKKNMNDATKKEMEKLRKNKKT